MNKFEEGQLVSVEPRMMKGHYVLCVIIRGRLRPIIHCDNRNKFGRAVGKNVMNRGSEIFDSPGFMWAYQGIDPRPTHPATTTPPIDIAHPSCSIHVPVWTNESMLKIGFYDFCQEKWLIHNDDFGIEGEEVAEWVLPPDSMNPNVKFLEDRKVPIGVILALRGGNWPRGRRGAGRIDEDR